MTFTINVPGVPAPQGSKSAFIRGGRAVVVEGSSKTGRDAQRAWRTAVTLEAIAVRLESDAIAGPVDVKVAFTMPRPRSAPKKLHWAAKKPDLDKLLRSTLDGLTDSGIFVDDSQVVQLFATKALSNDGTTGAVITITELER